MPRKLQLRKNIQNSSRITTFLHMYVKEYILRVFFFRVFHIEVKSLKFTKRHSYKKGSRNIVPFLKYCFS